MKPFERAVLHIGGEKTGSTSLQHRLDLSRELLEQQGFYQPTTGAHAGNCWGFAAIGQYHPKHSMHHQMTQATKSHEEAVEELIDAYKAELANARAKCDTLLVSSEHLQTVVDPRGIRRLLEWLATIAKQIDVVYVIRRQDQIIQKFVQHGSPQWRPDGAAGEAQDHRSHGKQAAKPLDCYHPVSRLSLYCADHD